MIPPGVRHFESPRTDAPQSLNTMKTPRPTCPSKIGVKGLVLRIVRLFVFYPASTFLVFPSLIALKCRGDGTTRTVEHGPHPVHE